MSNIDTYVGPILEYLNEAFEDKGLFPSGTHGWIRFYRMANDLKISKDKLIQTCSMLNKRKLIETNPPQTNIARTKPLIKITKDGIDYLEKLIIRIDIQNK